ncbi:hypothetical protein JCM14469_23060 [Desulfatiferula olefinivorans]
MTTPTHDTTAGSPETGYFACGHPDREFLAELTVSNFIRAKIAVGGFLAAGFLFFSLRLLLYPGYGTLPGYTSLFVLNVFIMLGSAVLLILFQRFTPDTLADVRPVHGRLVYAAAFFFTVLMSIASGVEYVGSGTLTRFFFTMFSLCIVFVINWYAMLAFFILSALMLVLTTLFYRGDILRLGVEHMHIPVLMIVSWLISRSFYMAAARGYDIRKQLARANRTLEEESRGRLKALDDLKRSEAQLKTLFDKAPDAFMLYDNDRGVFTEINGYAEQLFDYAPDDVIGKNYRDIEIITESQCRLIDAIVQETLEKTFAGPYEIPLTLRDGSVVVVDIRCSLITLQTRNLILATARDVTWRKVAEEELRKSNTDLAERVREGSKRVEKTARLLHQEISDHRRTENVLRRTEEQSRMLIENMNDGFLVFDADMKIRYSNERFCAMVSRPLTDIVGRSFYDFVDADHVQALRQRLDDDAHRDAGPRETVLVQKTGKRIHVYISPAALYGDDGAVEGRFSVIADISRMKSMETALRESEEMTRALLDACRDAVVMLKPDGTIFMANEMMAGRLGADTRSLKGKNLFDYFRSDQNPHRLRSLAEAVSRREPVIFEDQFDERHYLIHVYPINDDKPAIERIAVFARDITDLKNAEKHIHSLSQELIKVQERERQRISRDLHDNVAQELATMKITCDTLFSDPHPFPTDVVSKVSGLSRILQGTIMNVRNMAYDLRPPGLDQLGLVRTMTNYCEDFGRRNALAVDFFSAGLSGLSLSADTEINLYRIVQEGLHNVVKHARAGQVTIRLIASFPTIILRIEDNGLGFDINERLSEACAEKRMGLRSMEERARLLAGTIEFRSQSGRGTRIKVEIPMMDNVVNHNDKEACLNG